MGGNVATNAGGVCCVKYGVTRDYVLALEVVTGTGEVVRLGRRTSKWVAGYDLVGLMVGAEGTLVVVTEITVRLRRLPPVGVTAVGYFDSVGQAGDAVRATAAAGLRPAALELVDRHCLRAVDAWKNRGLSAEAGARRMVDCFRAAGSTGGLAPVAPGWGCCTCRSGMWWGRGITARKALSAMYPSLTPPRQVKIGDAAAFAGITPRAIRHYHEIGLLPEPERGGDGRRRYGYDDMIRLLWIRKMADAGISLDDMRAAFGEARDEAGDEALDQAPDIESVLSRLEETLAAQEAAIKRRRAAVHRLQAVGSPLGLLSELVTDRLSHLPPGALNSCT